jgi:hypothetical protein
VDRGSFGSISRCCASLTRGGGAEKGEAGEDNTHFGNYRLSLQKDDIVKQREQLKQLIEAAYKSRISN